MFAACQLGVKPRSRNEGWSLVGSIIVWRDMNHIWIIWMLWECIKSKSWNQKKSDRIQRKDIVESRRNELHTPSPFAGPEPECPHGEIIGSYIPPTNYSWGTIRFTTDNWVLSNDTSVFTWSRRASENISTGNMLWQFRATPWTFETWRNTKCHLQLRSTITNSLYLFI